MNFFKKDPLQIIAFQSYGTSGHLYCRGRALEDEDIDQKKGGFFNLLINTWKRFRTDEIKNTSIILNLHNGKTIFSQTDEKGYFLIDEASENLDRQTNEEGWLNFELSYSEKFPQYLIQKENRFPGEMLIPAIDSDFGVISDIDDTILHTGIVSVLKWQVLKNTVFKRPGKRLPLEGAPEFYNLLHRGKTGAKANPMFYVSHSPWNLYHYLEFFLKKNNFPKGPILLRTFTNPFSRKAKPEKPQKQKEIMNILKTYPQLSFILIGDSGEHDPDIYIEIAEAHPERILAIYLRSVKHKKRMIRVKGLFSNYETVPVLLVESSDEAVEHARKSGFI